MSRMRLGADIFLELSLNLTFYFIKKWLDPLFDPVSAPMCTLESSIIDFQ